MKTTLALMMGCLLSFALQAQQPAVQKDSVQTLQVAPDSLATPQNNWEIRRPLTREEEQRRADNRAEVESMKARFRAYHQTSEEQQAEETARAEDADYLWSGAETGGGAVQTKGTTPNAAPATNPEELRMEIGRNLQEGRSMSTPASPVRPAYPDTEMPASYDYPVATPAATNDWESDIRTSLQADTPRPNEQWQARAGAEGFALVNPQTGQPLQAGQTLILQQVRFADLDAALIPSTQDVLHQWAKVLRQYPQLIVQVRAHTHSAVAAFEAQQLTNQRAASIVDFWKQQGVPERQLSYRGYGGLSPLVSSADPQAQQKNERIELVILEMP
ncbi:MAG: OmpA family protein [Bacteroidota bacterium]